MNLQGILLFCYRALSFALIIGAIYTFYFALYKKQKLKNVTYLTNVTFICYISALLQITVIRNWTSFFSFVDNTYAFNRVQIIPLATTFDSLNISLWQFIYHLVGNMIWFVPFGLLLPFLSKIKTNFKNVIILSALLSFCIEVLQFIFNTGISDIDDIITNVLGAICGYLAHIHIVLIKIRNKCI